MNKLQDLILDTENKNPASKPDEYFTYIDVSSISNVTFKIIKPTRILGQQAPSRARKVIKKDDVIVATVRPTLKRVALVPGEYNDEICSTAFCVLRPNQNIILPEYLYFSLLSEKFINFVKRYERGANYPAVRDTDVKNYEIEVPSISEQKKAIDILKTIKLSIELFDEKKNKLNEIFNIIVNDKL